MPNPYVSVEIFEDVVRELVFEITRLNRLIGGTSVSDLSDLTSGETTIVDAINDAYQRHKVSSSDTITLPSNAIWPVPETLYLEGILINDGFIVEV